MNAKIEAVGSTPAGHASSYDLNQHGAQVLQRGKDKLLLDLNVVVDDAQALLKEVADSSVERIAGVPAYLEHKLVKVKGDLQRVRGAVEAKAKKASAATDQYVQANPWKSIACVSVASVLFSLVLVNACTSARGKAQGDRK